MDLTNVNAYLQNSTVNLTVYIAQCTSIYIVKQADTRPHRQWEQQMLRECLLSLPL